MLADDARCDRLLALTGLSPEELRAGLGDGAVLAAVLDFLAGHEPDLVAAADAMGIKPEAILAARRKLEA